MHDNYPNLIEALDYIAEQLIKKEHAEITKRMTDEERVSFVNAVSTLHAHSEFIQRNTLWNVN